MIYEKSCGAVIFTEADGVRLYLIELMKKGHCSICKGHVEKNETEHQTAEREIPQAEFAQVITDAGYELVGLA